MYIFPIAMPSHAMLSNYISSRYHINFEQNWSRNKPLRDSISNSFYHLTSNYTCKQIESSQTHNFALFFETLVSVLLSHAVIEGTVTRKIVQVTERKNC